MNDKDEVNQTQVDEINRDQNDCVKEEITTLGKKLVGLSFNPSGCEKVNKIKLLSAELIDFVYDNPTENNSLKLELQREAISRILDAQMWAVKTVTFRN